MNNISMKKHTSGFTLIELVVVVLIVSILSSMAYASYIKTTRKGYRTEAKTEMLDFAQRIQRCYTVNATFVTSSTEKCQILDNLVNGVATGGGRYRVTASAITATTYTLTATPVSGRGQDRDTDCASFTINQAGTRASTNQSSANTTSTCW